MDTIQIIIAICLSVITVVFVFAGVWVVLILTELRNSIRKVNIILDTTQKVTDSIAAPVSSFSEFLMGFKNGFTVFNKFFKDKKSTDD